MSDDFTDENKPTPQKTDPSVSDGVMRKLDAPERKRQSAIANRLKNNDNMKRLNEGLQQSTIVYKDSLKDLVGDPKEQAQSFQSWIKRNTFIVYGVIGLFAIVVAGFMYWQDSNKPPKGTIAYGICKNFLELYVQYPEHLRLATVNEWTPSKLEHSVRIWYAQRDAYGSQRMERMECHFNQNNNQTQLARVQINFRDLPASEVEKFNAALPAIQHIQSDLTKPQNFPSRIQDLRIDYTRTRKRYF